MDDWKDFEQKLEKLARQRDYSGREALLKSRVEQHYVKYNLDMAAYSEAQALYDAGKPGGYDTYEDQVHAGRMLDRAMQNDRGAADDAKARAEGGRTRYQQTLRDEELKRDSYRSSSEMGWGDALVKGGPVGIGVAVGLAFAMQIAHDSKTPVVPESKPLAQQAIKIPAGDTAIGKLNAKFADSAEVNKAPVKVAQNADGGYIFTVLQQTPPVFR